MFFAGFHRLTTGIGQGKVEAGFGVKETVSANVGYDSAVLLSTNFTTKVTVRPKYCRDQLLTQLFQKLSDLQAKRGQELAFSRRARCRRIKEQVIIYKQK